MQTLKSAFFAFFLLFFCPFYVLIEHLLGIPVFQIFCLSSFLFLSCLFGSGRALVGQVKMWLVWKIVILCYWSYLQVRWCAVFLALQALRAIGRRCGVLWNHNCHYIFPNTKRRERSVAMYRARRFPCHFLWPLFNGFHYLFTSERVVTDRYFCFCVVFQCRCICLWMNLTGEIIGKRELIIAFCVATSNARCCIHYSTPGCRGCIAGCVEVAWGQCGQFMKAKFRNQLRLVESGVLTYP